MSIYCLDTSAVLAGVMKNYDKVCISPIVIQELEHIKTHSQNEDLKYRAREAVRDIVASTSFLNPIFPQWKVNWELKKHSYLSNINDHRILCEALLELKAHGNDPQAVYFVTADLTQYLFAQRMGLCAKYLKQKELTQDTDYCGWGRYYPNERDMALLYSDPQMNILKAKTNEFCEIYEGSELKDVLFWTGERYRPLRYKEMRNPYLDEVLKPRNLEQKMAFDLLQNKDIKVKLLTSAWGGGKTLIALTYALEQIGKGNFQKLLFVRNNIIVADTNDIGYLPGELKSKLSIWGGPIADHLGGQEMLDQMIDDKVIEIFPLSHIRGRSLKDTIVVCDECENMNDKLVTLLMSRIEDGSELIFCGDVAQIDHKKFEKNNGIKSMIRYLSGEPLFGTIKLLKSERGAVARMCDLMRPPV